MSDERRIPTGQVAATPEGGPIDTGAPAAAPGAGQVNLTPEAGPLPASSGEALVPPTLRDHMQGPILGLDDGQEAPGGASEEQAAAEALPSPTAVGGSPLQGGGLGGEPGLGVREPSTAAAPAEAEPRKWPPYSGKPVSEVRWDDALRYAAPLVSQAEKVTIRAIDLSGRGLSRLARYLETRRAERRAAEERGRDES